MTLRNLLWGTAALAAIGLAGCSGGDSGSGATPTTTTGTTGTAPAGDKTGTTAAAKKDWKITMIAKSTSNPVFLYAQTGANAAAKELGEKNHVNITIDWRTPPDEDAQVQAQNIAQAVNDGADAILVSCSDAAKVTTAINDAVGKNVPVMTFDSDAPDSKRFAFYGTDDEDCGKQVMDELAKVMNEKGNYAILGGSQTSPNIAKRIKACEEEAKKYPNMKLVTVTHHVEKPQDAAAAVLQAMNANPQIDSWAMVGGWPLFTTSLMSMDPAKVKIVSVDALPQELGYVDKGIAPVLLAQSCYDWGYKSVGILVDKLILKKDVPVINKMDLVKVTKESLGSWVGELVNKWGIKDVDPKFTAMIPKK